MRNSTCENHFASILLTCLGRDVQHWELRGFASVHLLTIYLPLLQIHIAVLKTLSLPQNISLPEVLPFSGSSSIMANKDF